MFFNFKKIEPHLCVFCKAGNETYAHFVIGFRIFSALWRKIWVIFSTGLAGLYSQMIA